MSTSAQPTFTQDAFDAFLAVAASRPGCRDLRREAWHKSQELSLPTRQQEEWMRTDIRTLSARPLWLSGGAGGRRARSRRTVEPRRRSGRPHRRASTAASSRPSSTAIWPGKGVIFGSLDDGWSCEHGDLLRPYLSRRVVEPAADKFAALHAAWWSGGTVLYVPRGRRDRSAAAHVLGLEAGGDRFGPHAGRAGRRVPRPRCWPKPPASTRRGGLALAAPIELLVGPAPGCAM